jgi:hypothetical protein
LSTQLIADYMSVKATQGAVVMYVHKATCAPMFDSIVDRHYIKIMQGVAYLCGRYPQAIAPCHTIDDVNNVLSYLGLLFIRYLIGVDLKAFVTRLGGLRVYHRPSKD